MMALQVWYNGKRTPSLWGCNMAEQRSRRGMSLYRAADAKELPETRLGQGTLDFSAVSEEVTGRLTSTNGFAIKCLVEQSDDEGGFSLLHVWFKSNAPVIRHHHNDDCMYYVISGEAVMGSQTLRAGDSFFVPGLVDYQYRAGPEGVEVLEIRHRSHRLDYVAQKMTAGQEAAVLEAVRENADDWGKNPTSPTFAANATS
jgi:mannose-6-phosphate isomerase-like protein (cupin superfamily)